MKDYSKLINIKPQVGLKMEAKLTGEATSEDAGKALIRSYTIAAVGLMMLLTSIGVGIVILAIGTL